MKGFALRLVLKQRHKRTLKWPIVAEKYPLEKAEIIDVSSSQKNKSLLILLTWSHQ